MTPQEELKQRAKEWLRKTHRQPAAISLPVFGNGGRLGRFLQGETSFRDATCRKVIRWLDDNPPEQWLASRPRQGRPPKKRKGTNNGRN